MKISSTINNYIGKAYNSVAKSKIVSKTLDSAVKNPDRYAIAMVVTSIVSKDFVNCYYYVTQSLNNKKIPEEKRKFVASLDLMNGIIMVGGQLMAGILFEKILSKVLFDKLIAKKLDGDTLKRKAVEMIEAAKLEDAQKTVKRNFTIEAVHKELISKYGSGSAKYKAFKSGIELIVIFGATTALTKRVLAPLFATPLAGWYKEKFMDKKKKAEEAKNNPVNDWKSINPDNAMDKHSFGQFQIRK